MMDYEEKTELMQSEVNRLVEEYKAGDVCWNEMASSVHVDPRLDLAAQVDVYAQVCRIVDGDVIKRFTTVDEEETFVESYGVDINGGLTVEKYYFDEEGNLWGDIHSAGRRQWCEIADKESELIMRVEPLPTGSEKKYEASKAYLTKYCLEHGYAKRMATLPHIEDASQPMQEAYEVADKWDGPFVNIGLFESLEQFLDDYGMSPEEYKAAMQADINKYCVGSELEERDSEGYNAEFLYSGTQYLCEDFTAPIKE